MTCLAGANYPLMRSGVIAPRRRCAKSVRTCTAVGDINCPSGNIGFPCGAGCHTVNQARLAARPLMQYPAFDDAIPPTRVSGAEASRCMTANWRCAHSSRCQPIRSRRPPLEFSRDATFPTCEAPLAAPSLSCVRSWSSVGLLSVYCGFQT